MRHKRGKNNHKLDRSSPKDKGSPDYSSNSDEEDNNPFRGTTHMYSSGINGQVNLLDDQANEDLQEDEHSSISSAALPDPNSLLPSTLNAETDESTEPFVTLSRTQFSTTSIPEQPITIIDSGDYRDHRGKHAIGYVIMVIDTETGAATKIIRRYSDFLSLRHGLIHLMPTVVIPPLPAKHSLVKLIWNPTDKHIIESRKRLLASFLSNCYDIPQIRMNIIFRKFLDSDVIWKDVLASPPLSILPTNNLLAPPLAPTKPSPLHTILPLPKQKIAYQPEWLLEHSNDEALKSEKDLYKLELVLQNYRGQCHAIQNLAKDNNNHFKALGSFLSDLGAHYNLFSLENNLQSDSYDSISESIEKIGHAMDVNYLTSELLSERITCIVEEPIGEMTQFLDDIQRVINFRNLKKMQYEIIERTITRKQSKLLQLKDITLQLSQLSNITSLEAPTLGSNADHNNESEDKDEEVEYYMSQYHKHEVSAARKLTNKIKKRANSASEQQHLLTAAERQQEISRLEREVSKLGDCYSLIQQDMHDVNDSTLRSLKHARSFIISRWRFILRSITDCIIQWTRENLACWQDARASIKSTKS